MIVLYTLIYSYLKWLNIWLHLQAESHVSELEKTVTLQVAVLSQGESVLRTEVRLLLEFAC
jgi:hypothetical protein